jgi:acetyl esterase
MVAVVTQLARERKGSAIRYQVLFYPVTDSSLSQKSYEEFASGPWLTTAAMEWFWDAYAPNKEDGKNTTASPLSATAEQLKGLPPALVIVLATSHDFAMLHGLADTPAAKVAIELASAKLTAALNP